MSPKVHVSRWLKVSIYLVSLLPGLPAFGVFVPHRSWPGGNPWLTTTGFMTLLASSCWLFSRIHFLSSIVVTESGLEQTFLSFRGGFSRRVQLGWDEIATVSFSKVTFYFLGKGGENLELNTTLFNDMRETIRTVRDCLPARLRAQLND
jgi:hypothetical protein